MYKQRERDYAMTKNNTFNKTNNLVKVELPNGNKFLNPNLDLSRKKELVEEILESKVELYDKTITVSEYLEETWEKHETKIIIGNLAYFITYIPNNVDVQVSETP